ALWLPVEVAVWATIWALYGACWVLWHLVVSVTPAAGRWLLATGLPLAWKATCLTLAALFDAAGWLSRYAQDTPAALARLRGWRGAVGRTAARLGGEAASVAVALLLVLWDVLVL